MEDKEIKCIEHSTLQGILGDIGDAVIIVDKQENILYMNNAAEKLFDYEYVSGGKIKFSDVCRLVNVDTKESFYSPISRALREKKPVGLGKNVGFISSKGPVYLSATCSPMKNSEGDITGCSIIIRDISTLRRLEMKVESDQLYMRDVFQAAKVGMCSVNVRGELVDINEAALETMQVNQKIPYNYQLGDAFKCVNSVPNGCGHSEQCRYCAIRNNMEAAIRDDKYTNDFVTAIESLNYEEPIWLQVFVSQVWRNNQKQVVLSMINISKRKKREKELQRARKAAEDASNTKTQFLANMSHEIRTPINGMCGMINLTLKTDLSEEQRENLNSAKQCSEDLLRIINDILDYAKIESGKMEIEKIDLDLYELLDRVCKLHGQVAAGKGVVLVEPIVDKLPRYIKGDPLRIRQILHNLLTNAIKFTSVGSVNVYCGKVRQGKIDMLEFSVEDTGIGMTDDEQSKLFKPFSQVDGSTTRRFGGTGLGLTIVKELVTAMGGDIVVNSRPNYGSKFTFWIPLVIAHKADKELKDNTIFINPYINRDANSAVFGLGEQFEDIQSDPDDDIMDLLRYCNDKMGNA